MEQEPKINKQNLSWLNQMIAFPVLTKLFLQRKRIQEQREEAKHALCLQTKANNCYLLPQQHALKKTIC